MGDLHGHPEQQRRVSLHASPSVTLSRSEGSLLTGVEMLRGVYPERSECAQHDSPVTYTDASINLFICIIGLLRTLHHHKGEKVKMLNVHIRVSKSSTSHIIRVFGNK